MARPGRYRHLRAVAALVLEAFVSPRPRGHLTGYADGDRTNVALLNLSWIPHSAHPRFADVKADPWARAARAAEAVLPGNLSAEARADILAEMVMEHLSGGMALEEFKARAMEFIRDYNRLHGTWGKVSLDQDVRGAEGLRLGETFSQEDYDARWEMLR
jgi:hypothetical protein